MSFPTDTAHTDGLRRALEGAAPNVSDAGAWDVILPRARRIRRRRNLTRGGVTFLMAAMLVGGAVYLASLQPTDGGDLTQTTLVQPTPGASGLPPAPASPTAEIVPWGDPDPRAAAVREWLQAFGAGDLDTAWALLDIRAQEEYGSLEAFTAAAADVTLRWGSWSGAGSWADLQLVDLGSVDGERLAVASLYGRWSSGDHTAPRADALLVVSRTADGGGGDATVSRVDPLRLLVADDPSESALVDEGQVPAFESPAGNGAVLPPQVGLRFALPRTGDQSFPPAASVILALDDGIVGEGDLVFGKDGGLHGYYDPPALPPGRHVATVVFGPDDGHRMSAATVFFTVDDGARGATTSTTPGPAAGSGGLAPRDPGLAQDLIEGLLRAVREDDRESFVDLYASTDRATAESIFALESARFRELGRDAYLTSDVDAPVVNWMADGRWVLTWTPLSPSPELGAWVDADPLARMLASLTTADGVTRFLPLDVDGAEFHIHVLGGDPGMEALGAFDLLGRAPSDVVATYFAAMQRSRYEAAWELLSDGRPSRDRFAEESAAAATPERREAGQYVILDNGDAWVDVVVLSPPDYRREGVPVTERWLLVKQGGEWRLDHAARDLPLP